MTILNPYCAEPSPANKPIPNDPYTDAFINCYDLQVNSRKLGQRAQRTDHQIIFHHSNNYVQLNKWFINIISIIQPIWPEWLTFGAQCEFDEIHSSLTLPLFIFLVELHINCFLSGFPVFIAYFSGQKLAARSG